MNCQYEARKSGQPRHARFDRLNVTAPHEQRGGYEADWCKDGSDGQIDGRILDQAAHGAVRARALVFDSLPVVDVRST